MRIPLPGKDYELKLPKPSKEIWKPIAGFEEDYLVSNQGRVCLCHMMRSFPSRRDGYIFIGLSKKGCKRSRFGIHQLVARAFVEGFEIGLCVNHKNGKKTDNRPANLEWVTIAENNRHAIQHGLRPLGEKHPSAKLTKKQVREIRKKNAQCKGRRRLGLGAQSLAKEYGVTQNAIRGIIKRRTWKHVK